MGSESRQNPINARDHLLDRARAGDSQAFDRLFVRHKDGVYACLWHLLNGDPDLVEEAVGNVFLNAYRSLRQFRSESSLSTWLYRIAVNEARARIRQKRRGGIRGWFSLNGPNAEITAGPDPAEEALRTEEERILWKAVRALPEPFRTPIVLRYLSGLGSPQIADALRRPAGTVRYQLSRGLQILRERLGDEWTT